MLQNIKFNVNRMYETADAAFSTATDVAEYLVKKGLPFRRAHEITGKLVLYCSERNKKFEDLTLEELNKFSDLFLNDIFNYLNAEGSVKNKKSLGSTSLKEVTKQIIRLRKIVSKS